MRDLQGGTEADCGDQTWRLEAEKALSEGRRVTLPRPGRTWDSSENQQGATVVRGEEGGYSAADHRPQETKWKQLRGTFKLMVGAGKQHSTHLPLPPPGHSSVTYFGSFLFGLFQFVHFNLLGFSYKDKRRSKKSSPGTAPT